MTARKILMLYLEQVGQDRPEKVVHRLQGSHHTSRLRSARRNEPGTLLPINLNFSTTNPKIPSPQKLLNGHLQK